MWSRRQPVRSHRKRDVCFRVCVLRVFLIGGPDAALASNACADMSAKAWDALTGDELWNFDHPSVVKQARGSPITVQRSARGARRKRRRRQW